MSEGDINFAGFPMSQAKQPFDGIFDSNQPPKTDAKPRCDDCGAEIEEDWFFCPYCCDMLKADFHKDELKFKFCPRCGKERNVGGK